MIDTDQVFQVIQALPVRDRLRLVERVVHTLADSSETEPAPSPRAEASALLCLFADEPDLVDDVCHMALSARKRDALRTGTEDDEITP